MKRVKIVHKITLWYTLLTVILLAFLIPILYISISTYLYKEEVNQLHMAFAEAVSGVEIENHAASMNDATSIDPGIPTIIWDDAQRIIFENSEYKWLASVPFDSGQIRKIDNNNEIWLLYDGVVMDGNRQVAAVRVSSSFEAIESALRNTQLVILVSIPLFLLLAVCGSFLIAKRSLKPIRMITQTANHIGDGDLSHRIDGIESRDEVGDLAAAVNDMLEKIETLFMKERLFSSAASHELRSPVAVIMAYCEALLEESRRGGAGEVNETDDAGRKDETDSVGGAGGVGEDEAGGAGEDEAGGADSMDGAEKVRALEQMLKESRRMNTIISQLLLLARGDEGKYTPVFEEINLAEVVNTVLQQLEEQADSAGIALMYHGEENIPVTADQSMMTQMMLNLIENAIKYGKAGGRVDVFVKQENNLAEIRVSDDGAGIGPEDLPHIFERFYRADKSRDRNGSGLGLSIVEWIVEAHHGEIRVDSAVGSGTVFTVTLPKSKN